MHVFIKNFIKLIKNVSNSNSPEILFCKMKLFPEKVFEKFTGSEEREKRKGGGGANLLYSLQKILVINKVFRRILFLIRDL